MDTLPFQIETDQDDPDCAEIFVNGTVDGKMFKFLLDTGSSKTIIESNPFTDTYSSHGTYRLEGLFGQLTCDLININSLMLGPISKGQFELCRMPKNGPTRSQIGMDILKNYAATFYFEKQRIILDGPPPTQPMLDFILDEKSIPYVELSIDGIKCRCFWDTGAGISVVDINFLSSTQTSFRFLGDLEVDDTTESSKVPMPMYQIINLQVSGKNLPPHKVIAADLSQISKKIGHKIDIVLGYTSLRHANWYLDFSEKKWTIL